MRFCARHVSLACGLAAALVAPRMPAATPVGFFDVADCNALIGWACDADDYDAALELHFYADGPAGVGAFVGVTRADSERADVAPVCGGRSRHGFGVPPSPLLKDGRGHSIYIYALNVGAGTANPLLGWAPRSVTCAYQAPSASLKYFGFAGAGNSDAFVAETAPFSNAIPVPVDTWTQSIVARVNTVVTDNARAMPTIMNVLFCRTTGNIPGTDRRRFKLWGAADCEECQGVPNCPDYLTRWNTFRTTNGWVLNSTKVSAFYVADEPTWNGISAADLATATDLVANAYPGIPRATVEAWPVVGSLAVPTSMTWIGFDLYGVAGPQFDPTYVGLLNTLKSRRSTTSQRIIIVMDAWWQPSLHGAQGIPAGQMASVALNYYDLARSDAAIVGLFGFLWPTPVGEPGTLGARDMPASALKTYDLIGRSIAHK